MQYIPDSTLKTEAGFFLFYPEDGGGIFMNVPRRQRKYIPDSNLKADVVYS